MDRLGSSLDSRFRLLFHAVFFFSGAAALTYEILWTRQISLVTGATTPAVAAILAVFMGGLALGAWVFGRVADRSPRLLVWYGAIEICIGICALLQPAVTGWMASHFVGFLSSGAHGTAQILLRVAFASTLLLLPAALMGGTLPLLVRHASRGGVDFGRSLGSLYAANLSGAVIGSALTGFLLIRSLGVTGTLYCAVAVNLSVGALALALALVPSPVAHVEMGASVAEQESPVSSGLEKVLWLVLMASGFLTMAYEVAWTRVLVFSFGSSIHSFTLILMAFLLGLSLGSFAISRWERAGPATLLGVQVLAASTAVCLVPFSIRIPAWMESAAVHWGASGAVHLAISALGATVVMLLPASFMGVVFPMACRLLARGNADPGRRLGRAYWVNTIGSISGSLFTGIVLVPVLSLKATLSVLACLQVGVALALLPWCAAGRSRTLLGLGSPALLGLSFVALLLLPTGPASFDPLALVQGGPGAKVEAHRDDMNAAVTVVRSSNGIRTLRIDGFIASGTGSLAGYMPMMSHLPLLLHGEARRELVICFGTGATAGAALLHPGVQVDVVDINRSVLDFAAWFRDVNHDINRDPRATLIHDDGRNFLLTTHERYDVITSEPMPPTQAGVVNLYSREYYQLARERLNPGGLVVQWLPFHLLTEAQTWSILRTVQEVFPETTLWMHSFTGLIIARKDAPLAIDAGLLDRAMHSTPLAADLGRLGVGTVEDFAQLFALSPGGVAALSANAPLITDNHPSLEFDPPQNQMSLTLNRGLARHGSPATLAVFAQRNAVSPTWRGAPPPELERIRAKWPLRNALQAGQFMFSTGGYKEAIACFAGCLELAADAQDRSIARYNLASTLLAAGDRVTAKREAERCLQDAPSSITARRLLESLQDPR